MIHSIHVQNLCAELKQKVQERQRRKSLSRERQRFKECRNEINERIDEVRRIEELTRNNEIRSAMKKWTDCALHIWDTRITPSNIFELEAAAELPYSHKKWLH